MSVVQVSMTILVLTQKLHIGIHITCTTDTDRLTTLHRRRAPNSVRYRQSPPCITTLALT